MKTIVETIAKKYLLKWSIWQDKRLYINDCRIVSIYNTRKCKQSVYIDLVDMSVHCYTDCPGQGSQWLYNENERILDGLSAFARLLRIATRAQLISAIPVDVVMNNALLDAEEVIGYYTEWREVRIAINRFGKLAMRNRQFVVAFKGSKSDAPRGFVSLSCLGYALLVDRYKGVMMLEPYSEAPDFNAISELITRRN